MPYFDMSQFDVFVNSIHDPSLSPYLLPKFLHSSYTIGCLNHYCMHCMGPSNFEWSTSRVLPPHEVVLGCTGLSIMTVLFSLRHFVFIFIC